MSPIKSFVVPGLVAATAAALALSPPDGEPGRPVGPPSPPSPESERPAPGEPVPPTPRSEWTTAVEPKPITPQVRRGLEWLAAHQHENGGWAQGDAKLRQGEAPQPNVGDTAAATLALLRSGSSAAEGSYAPNVLQALEFIMGHVERSDPEDLSVSSGLRTRLQAKLGPNIDTFLAALVLTEARGTMPDEDSENRLAAALDKVLHKIQVNQGADGMWRGHGWAPALADALAVKGLNRARQRGFAVANDALRRAETNAVQQFMAGRGTSGGADSAGIALYATSKNVGVLADSVATNRQRATEVREMLLSAPTTAQRDQARRDLERFEAAEAALADAKAAVLGRLQDEGFVAGFGSNGGEEFLSYLNIGESLILAGGDDWARWDDQISRNLIRVQNGDGSWTGHHCITGRTFCTSSALLVLMLDRMRVPPETLASARAASGEPIGGPQPVQVPR